MRMSVTLCLVAAMSCASAQEQKQEAAVPESVQKLRAPLTNIPLRELFENMQSGNTVSFYTDCVTGEGRCNHVGAALRHLLVDLRPNQEPCYGCTTCQKEKVQYVLDTMKERYPQQACKVQKALQRPVYAGFNPCV